MPVPVPVRVRNACVLVLLEVPICTAFSAPTPKFVRTLDFGVLDGLGMRAAAEIRGAEDALIAFTEQQAKRDALHVKTTSGERWGTHVEHAPSMRQPAVRAACNSMKSRFGALLEFDARTPCYSATTT